MPYKKQEAIFITYAKEIMQNPDLFKGVKKVMQETVANANNAPEQKNNFVAMHIFKNHFEHVNAQ